MKREAKYTLISGITHIAFLSLLALGSAFVATRVSSENKEQVDALPVIHQIPNILVDEAIYNAGGAQEVVQTPVVSESPVAAPPQVQVAPPVKQPETKTVTSPSENKIKEVKQVKSEKPVVKKEKVKTTEVKSTPKKTKPKTVDLNSMLVKQDTSKTAQKAREAAAAEREAAAAQAAAIANAARINALSSDLQGSISTSTSKKGGYSSSVASTTVKGANAGTGDGTGIGPAVANYKQVIRSMYNNAWTSPSTLTECSLRTIAQITIRRDGTVISAKITRFSGDKDLDNSVKKTIDSIHQVPAFPKNSTDSTRTYSIGFNLKGADF